MKKVVLASLLACAAIASGLPSASAQQPVNLGSQPSGQIQMPDAEFQVYNNAMTQTDPRAKAAALEAYLTQFPQSAVTAAVLETAMALYSGFDTAKMQDAADRLLKVDPNNIRGLYAEALLHRSAADSITDPAAKQAALDSAAGFAQRCLTALAGAKPAGMADADFKALQTGATPSLYSVIGYAAFNKKDSATAEDAYKKELASVPLAETQKPGSILQDTFYLGVAYFQAVPPDLLSCAFYAARAVDFAPDNFKAQMAPTAKYCYRKYHGAEDGYDAFAAAAQANLNPPDGLFSSIKPAPTNADIVNTVISTTPDLGSLAPGDKEFILAKVQVAISEDAVQSKTADFTFNLAPPEDIPEPKPTATPAQKLAYKKAVAAAEKKAADDAAATAVGNKVTLDGTYDSFSPSPIMIIMKDAEVVLPKAAAPKPATPAHRPAGPAKKQ